MLIYWPFSYVTKTEPVRLHFLKRERSSGPRSNHLIRSEENCRDGQFKPRHDVSLPLVGRNYVYGYQPAPRRERSTIWTLCARCSDRAFLCCAFPAVFVVRHRKPRRSGVWDRDPTMASSASPERMQHVLRYATQPSSPLVAVLVVDIFATGPPKPHHMWRSHCCLPTKPRTEKTRPSRASEPGSGTLWATGVHTAQFSNVVKGVSKNAPKSFTSV
jgi:hypothetical protein